MNSIQQVLSSNKELSHAKIKMMFKSKKNIVYLINLNNKQAVLKIFSEDSKKSIINEYNELSSSNSNYAKPEIISYNKEQRFILMTYISGENMCDLINNNFITIEKKTQIIQRLAIWFWNFHKTHHQDNKYFIHGDANLRNFIYNGKVIGLDFEETHIANPIEDVANMCASILTTDPQFTDEKKELQDLFIQTYQDHRKERLTDITGEINKAIEKVQKRRKKGDIKRN
jgi:tRNA A-37 threonylcarbamoyl transferase component Bud32